MDSDSEERELERLVFGNDIDFQHGISKLADATRANTATLDLESEVEDDEVEETTGLESLDDADVRLNELTLDLRSS
jgi:hypothetical protein